MIAVQRVLPAALIDVISRQPTTPEKVDFAWRTAVGPAVARATMVTLDRDGTLVVTADDERWLREIRQSLPLVQARLERLLGDSLTSIALRARQDAERPRP
jgi:predicted nucleic acid-binding Zn ribbon protein